MYFSVKEFTIKFFFGLSTGEQAKYKPGKDNAGHWSISNEEFYSNYYLFSSTSIIDSSGIIK